MTPAARVASAIGILDAVLAGQASEQALTAWARRSRYAGSRDRAAVRDLVFDAVRCRRSLAMRGGAMTGRGLMIGLARVSGDDPDTLFDGSSYGPAPLSKAEAAGGGEPDMAAAQDLPDWIWERLCADHGAEQACAIAGALRQRAPLFLRVNPRRATPEAAIAMLAGDGIDAAPCSTAPHALRVVAGARKLRQSEAYRSGLVELQDAASQAVVALLPLSDGMRVLDMCAGGGGKTLAMAARARLDLTAYDIAYNRMRDLPARAQRAGARVTLARDVPKGPFDLILCDVPCSGSGAWRRSPDGKWALTPDQLAGFHAVQSDILTRAAERLHPGGCLAYATCSVFRSENEDVIEAFRRQSAWSELRAQRHFLPGADGDGFYTAQLTRV